MKGGKRTRSGLLLGILILLSVQFVLSARVFLPVPHNGGDNAGYIALAYSILHRGEYVEIWDPQEPAHTKYPPVFPLLLAGAMALGVKGWVGLKTIPFASTLLAGLFTYLWARGRGGDVFGLSVALLLALSDGVLYYSHWILSDPTFLALTMGALWAMEKAAGKGDEKGEKTWMALGFAMVLLAYFTRSAGLPLVVATLLGLAIWKRWRYLATFAVVFLVPAGLWWLRARLGGGSEYAAEFWLVDPYRPEMGRLGPGTFLLRIWENLAAYSTDLIPEGIVGGAGRLLPLLGLALVILALVGWARSLRKEAKVAELFFPLYAGLMLLWPQVWSGDRFALPLIPLLLFFSGKALVDLLARASPYLRAGILGLAFLLVAVPAGRDWVRESGTSRACREVAEGGDPWACEPVTVQEYVLMAQWAGETLPDGAAVVTRKPRIFYVLSGVKTLSLPLTSDPEIFLGTAREKGAQYVTLDRWDGLARYYLGNVLDARPDAFCGITGVKVNGEMGIQLLGIQEGGQGPEEGYLPQCPGEMVRKEPRDRSSVSPGVIPLLAFGSG